MFSFLFSHTGKYVCCSSVTVEMMFFRCMKWRILCYQRSRKFVASLEAHIMPSELSLYSMPLQWQVRDWSIDTKHPLLLYLFIVSGWCMCICFKHCRPKSMCFWRWKSGGCFATKIKTRWIVAIWLCFGHANTIRKTHLKTFLYSTDWILLNFLCQHSCCCTSDAPTSLSRWDL